MSKKQSQHSWNEYLALAIGAIAVVGIGIGIATLAGGPESPSTLPSPPRPSSPVATAGPQTTQTTGPVLIPTPVRINLPENKNAIALGPAQAKVTMVEFSNYG